jgi:multidrug efflux pump subunit AcrA (membrane-fusion protein)
MTRKAVWMIFFAFVLAGCSSAGANPQPLPTVVLDSEGAETSLPSVTQTAFEPSPANAEVIASGVVSSVHQVEIASAQGGKVDEILIHSGDQVSSGSLLVRLAGRQKLLAAVEAARTELLAAQTDLQNLKDNAEKTRSAALLRLANASKALDDAKKVRGYRDNRNGSDSNIAAARADLIVATDVLNKAQDAYNYLSKLGDENLTKAGALSALSSAQKAYDRAVANLNYLTGMPNQIDVDIAEAELQVAQSEYDSAKTTYEKLQDGLDPEVLALAEQRVINAQAQLAASQAALSDVELTAPFDGTVAELFVDPGSWVSPGQPLLIVADLQNLQVSTTDLSERDVPSVQVGQPVSVFVKALGITIDGKVIEISPLAETLGGDVVYATKIELAEQPAGLRIGMSADVMFLNIQ